MDRIQRLNYEKDFRIAILESRGDGLERLFDKCEIFEDAQVMEVA